jgi:hypothetical protein
MASETMVEGFTEPRPELTAQAWADLLPALTRLDALLEQALTQAETVYGPEAAADLYRGLYVSQDQAVSLLKQRPGQPLFAFNGQGNNQRRLDAEWLTQPPLQALQQQYELSTFELDLILIALAPELDRRYERIYAYLQDHVSRRWPSVDLALNLLCANAVERLERRSHFAPHAPLFRHQILHLLPDPQGNTSSLLAQSFQLDEQIVRLLLDQRTLDTRLAPFCGWQDELKADASAALLHPRFQPALGELAESAQ